MHSSDLVTVHDFMLWSDRVGRYLASGFKASLEVIHDMHGLAVEGTAEEVPAHALDEAGLYQSIESGWQSSSFDLQQGLEVTEDVQPAKERSANEVVPSPRRDT